MQINLDDVGAFSTVDAAGRFSIRFGVYLPGIRSTDGYEVVVRIIHAEDRFDANVQTVDVPLDWQAASALSLWSSTVALTNDPRSHFGRAGLYLYRFQLFHTAPDGARTLVTRWFTDPFARQTDVGMLAAVVCGDAAPAPFAWTDDEWKTPGIDDLIVYELHVDQFNSSFEGVVDRIAYLKSLGVSCLELMPVTSTKLDFDWGYGPIHYFAPNPVYGGPDGLKRLVDRCHANGIAVILDLVYQHVDPAFAYDQVYGDIARAGLPAVSSPMIGAAGDFGPKVDFSQTFAQEYFQLANQRWLDEYHVDGFRYDEVTDLYQGPEDTGYALLAYETYRYSRSMTRFGCGPGTYSRIVQCAEALQKAPEVLRSTYTSAAWQDDLLNLSESVIGRLPDAGSLTSLVHALDPSFNGRYPATKTVVDTEDRPVEMSVAPFQYLNSHDHSHLVWFAGQTGEGVLTAGDRSLFYKVQPFAIALFTCQGVPMLWEGEEFGDNYQLADKGPARVNLRRDMNWSYFYDDAGVPLIRLFRKLGRMRAANPALRSRESYFFYEQSLRENCVVAYSRHSPGAGGAAEQFAMVFLNFGPQDGTIAVPFPRAGRWTEAIDGAGTVLVNSTEDLQVIDVPSNYGRVYLL